MGETEELNHRGAHHSCSAEDEELEAGNDTSSWGQKKREYIVEEKCGLERVRRYWRNEECPGKLKSEEISRLENAPKVTGNNWKLAWILPYLLPQVFFNFILPAGFPGSVSDDYIYFMLWQFPTNVAGWASTTIVTDSLLTAVGIETNPATTAGATAAIKWISKDALGALGRLFIGGRFGRVFDEDPKQWRIYGDLVASTGNVLELLTPLFPGNFLLLASLGYLLQAMGKGLVGPSNLVAQTHFAIAENVGDVLAKDEVWLVVGELCGLGLGIGILATPGMTTYWKLALTWVVLRILHLYLRYIMVSTLCLYTINYKRALLLIDAHIKGFPVPGRHKCNKMENIMIPRRFTTPYVHIGSSLKNLLGSQPLTQEVEELLKLYDDEKHLLFLHRSRFNRLEAHVLFKEDFSSLTILRSLYQASLLLLPNHEDSEDMQALLGSSQLHNANRNSSSSSHEMMSTDDGVISLRGQGSSLSKSLHLMQKQFDSFVNELEEVGWDLKKIVLKLPDNSPLLSQP
ncbi:unnamed protein product [Sphagnum jensenii]|uniref:Uncharacterized protein n=1 Tax=Sphagnum jensenii TaxID=128206 RepID=A0ABP1BPT6_9BRYO